MEKVKMRASRLWGLLIAMLVAFAVMGVAALPQSAYADEAAVRENATGIMKFNWKINGEPYSRGSAFLINDDHVITAYHCTFFSEDEMSHYGFSAEDRQDLRDQCTYSVTINRDVTIDATYVNGSEEQDFAIFKLAQHPNGYTPLKFNPDSSKLEAGSVVWALGFPGNNDLKYITDYTASDVTFKSGRLIKTEDVYELPSNFRHEPFKGYYLQTDCQISDGASGGPMTDDAGGVVGVCVMGNQADGYYYAAAADRIMSVLDTLGIKYDVLNGPSDVTYELAKGDLGKAIADAEALAEKTDDVTKKLEEAKKANDLMLSDPKNQEEYNKLQGQIDTAASDLAKAVAAAKPAEASSAITGPTGGTQTPGGNGGGGTQSNEGIPMWLIIVIVVAVVAVIAIIAVVMLRKKKNTPPAPAPAPQPQQQLPPAAPPAAPVAPSDAANETTILSGDQSDTVVLNQAANGGSLTRMSTNEQIPINSAEFSIGRDRGKVNYCIEGNSSISRIHARIVVRDGKAFLIDNKAANGTYVNGVKARPGQEILLKSGDVITLADEKFKYMN